MTNEYDESIQAADGAKLVGYGPRRFDVEHSHAVIDAETCSPEEAAYWAVYVFDAEGLPTYASGKPVYMAKRPDRAGAIDFAGQLAEQLERNRSMSYGYDSNILDAAGNRLVSYGPRRIEVERVVGGKSYVSYRQHHAENDDPDAHIEACLPAEAAFWGVYKHDAEGLAAIVGDAHDEASAKAFAEQVARVIELEAQLIAAVNAMPSLFSSLVNVELDHSRAKRIEQGIPRYVVDGHEFPNEESNFLGDGEYPPFVIFDVDRQENLPGEYGTRTEADQAAALKNAETQRWVVLAIDTNTAAFKDLGHASEVARLLRDAGAQLQSAPALDSVRLVDTNDNEVGRLYATDVMPDLESPGMINLVVNAGEDAAFGATEADRMALAAAFCAEAKQLGWKNELGKRQTTFTVEVREAPYDRTSTVRHVKVGHFYYMPAPELESQLVARDAATPEI